MPEIVSDSQYFARSVAQLGADRPIQTVKPVYGARGIKILEKGARLTPGLYERLARHHPTTPLDDALEIEASVNGKNLRAAGVELLDHTPVLAHMAERALLLDCLEAVPLPPAVVFQLTVVRDVHPEQFRYFVATALIAVWLANRPQATRKELVLLAAAGLLHDLGMMHIDPILLQPRTKISREQRRQLYSHPLVSVLLLERHPEYPPEMLRAIREHHEVLDGSGYPGGLAGNAISPWGRTLSLAQVVASLVKPGRGHAALRLSVLIRTNRHRFDAPLVERLLPLLKQMAQANTEASGIENPVDDPIGCLNRIHQMLLDWPAGLTQDARLSPTRRNALVFIGDRCARILRTLVESGVSTEQLHNLGHDAITGMVADELSLITHELAWQLRALEREARRRWGLAAQEQWPESLALWMAQVDGICTGLIHHADGESTPASPQQAAQDS